MGLRARVADLISQLPGALVLSFLTAVTTVILIIVLSIVFGSENTAHREAARCQAAYIVDVLQEIAEQRGLDLEHDEDIETSGLDCSKYLTDPFVEDR